VPDFPFQASAFMSEYHPHQHHGSEGGEASGKWQKREHYRHQYTPDSYAEKKAFRHASNTLGFAGFAGHLLRTGGILAPLIIGEFVKDPDKKWKAIRLSAVATAVISEAMYAYHNSRKKEACREEHAAHDAELEERLRSAFAGGDMTALGMGR
jgi:hypothetical protein